MREEMNTREKKLQVKDLTISFRTINGKLQAVRDISFDLYKGETLAIVGESGSGKSATSKTILGISAPNTIIESGEILYDGKDLLKISEDDYHEIRGDKISMIFQDPLSSLNPVMRIGNQITEAMLLKNKANRRESKKKLNVILKKLALVLKETESTDDDKRFDTFKKIIGIQSRYEAPYEQALSNAKGGLKAAEDMLLSISKEAITNPVAETKELEEYLRASVDRFVVRDADSIKAVISGIQKAAHEGAKSKNYEDLKEQVKKAKAILEKALENERPDFFALGCYIVLGSNSLEGENSGELNIKTRPYLDSKFMQDFKSDIRTALVASSKSATEGVELAIVELRDASKKLSAGMPERAEALRYAKEISDKVEAGIDPFETVKNSFSYTFRVSLASAINVYYDDIVRNAAEEKRFERQSARYARLEAKGKAPEAAVAPLSLSDLSLVRANIIKILDNMADQYENQLVIAKSYDFDKRTEIFINWLRETAMGCFRVITKSMAKDRAIRVMEQVGITEARKRYRQFPFEFSGGMRQRIVIAIALTANPDILICDEPTTALDVTIQAQILELINKLKQERDLSVIFITHDLGVVANMADRIAVMYAGKIVEYGTSEDVFYSPAHPYTWALLASIPDLDSKGNKLESIPGTPPNMIFPPKGDAFAARNKYAMEIDFEEQPPMFRISDTHYAATWLLHPDAPKVEMPEIVKDRIARMGGR
ncbi:MAG: ABC transporter ATP-binding protein [Spirochaetales bacterium]|nr:ABC transporter ATP-binding protein [Spirochaetales bacterium]